MNPAVSAALQKLADSVSALTGLRGGLDAIESNMAFLSKTIRDAEIVAPAGPTVYAQRDVRWGGQLLGRATKYTIGMSGCLMTDYASATTDAGRPMDPGQMNDWLKSNGGFVADNEGQIVSFVYAAGDQQCDLEFDTIA